MTPSGNAEHVTPSILYHEGRITFEDIWTKNRAMRNCIEDARLIAPYDKNVLILGECGTGKNLLAQAIHNASPRKGKPFEWMDVGELSETLVEDALFGHERGAFTGADAVRLGCFERANGGTLFLDEIGNLSPNCQAKLLKAVESRRVRRVGGQKEIDCDARVISATNVDLKAAIAENRFRRDLYYRLCYAELRLPPLRDRVEDLERLAALFIEHANWEFHRSVKRISPACLALMADYPWPGNVRELRAAIGRAMLFCRGEELLPEHLFPETCDDASHVTQPGMEQTLETIERRHILRVLRLTGGNKTQAAKVLGITRPTLYQKLKKHGVEADPQASE